MHFSCKLHGSDCVTGSQAASVLKYPLPPVLKGFYQRKILTGTFHLGETADYPLYAVSVQSGWGMLAKAADETGWTHNVLNNVVTLPPFRGTQQDTVENMLAAVDHNTATFQFSIDVGYNQALRREFFEWRKIKSIDNKGLLHSQFQSGFKLVRMGSGGVFRQPEVVATIAFHDGITMTLPFFIQFFTSLGDRWAIMVIVTALKIWALNIKGNATASYIYAQGDGWVTRTRGEWNHISFHGAALPVLVP